MSVTLVKALSAPLLASPLLPRFDLLPTKFAAGPSDAASAASLSPYPHAALASSGLQQGDFGTCPRVYCDGQHILPIGLSDIPGEATVKTFCPRCNECYIPKVCRPKPKAKPRASAPLLPCSARGQLAVSPSITRNPCPQQQARHQHVDGAYFGTTFPHMLFAVHPEYVAPHTEAVATEPPTGRHHCFALLAWVRAGGTADVCTAGRLAPPGTHPSAAPAQALYLQSDRPPADVARRISQVPAPAEPPQV